MTNEFEPKITAFLCNWCSYAGADLAGTSRMQYPTNIRIIKVPCTGRLDPIVLVKAFEIGADGVLVSGCHPNDCHYRSGNFYARRRWIVFKDLLEYVGIEPGRVQFSWVSAAEGGKFVEVVTKITDDIKFPLKPLGSEEWPCMDCAYCQNKCPAWIKAQKGETGPKQFKNLIRYRILEVKNDDPEIPEMENQIKTCILCGNCTKVCETIVGAKLKEFNEKWREGKI